ncbi:MULTISPECIES: ABC transporter ATP-binding protein [unclassified Haloferax]|uniref:ABC transporter ATP-binding protein n=1 Tax=unclassified Haloferax TaxID=2625095 RepID=UPI0002B11A5A|nr:MULTISPECIES: ABC transporter ATP-binding protein [unclassified Haloferax]ELZ56285.1 putative sugar ABC transporter ATP-binding protein [Haloferax sp. ATCC BAA-646]ELZ67631.1 putative sugar ABC transporter ATP-binding protein [Haloferax sp. ATCC BAA-645]ELZ68203.1 putative sugar ABC transporter ATP-binding protein [Haloferax sp. ATCC BAA-644]
MTDTTAPAVQLTDITKRFGDVVANDSVDLTLDRGSIHAVIGENGAGKTTLMNVLYGLYDPNEGTIAIDGEPRSFDSPRDAIAAGIGMIHQHFQLVDNMTVLQNIVLGHEPSTRGLVDEQAARRRVTEICDTYGFSVDEHLDTPIEELGLGIQQHVEIVKSLYRGADTLILDEPTAVLTPQEVEGLFDVMEALTADGRSLIFITHKLDEAMHAADDITVLRDGSAVGTVDAAATSQNELARMMVGREVLFDVDSRGGPPGEVALTVDGVTVRDERGLEQVRDVSLSVREGEILGIAGVEGNGQQELIEAITGMRTPERGTVSLQGRDITELSRRRRIEDGISYVPGDRLEEGLVQDYSLVRNALLSNQTMDAFSDGLFLDWGRIGDHADEIIDAYDVRPRNPEATAKSLSGGNQQKFIVGRELERDPSVLVAAHPTRGVDIGSIEFIHQRFQDMRAEGVAILLVSSKLDEVQKLSDRTAVMYEGSVVDTVDPDDVTEEELGLLMAGRARDGTERAARGAEGDA